ncbi:aspartate dehydrogenase [Ponticoccus sp. (in: a-proteobacteria)]|uniref:aspartate dehydrogenase n=1 Tax=Ponticoccus sp. (in: a-proteobacteria) TaxID=1925025 RepID=UPI003AB3615B
MITTQTIGIAGIGAIGARVARAVDSGSVPGFELCGLSASHPDRLAPLNADLTRPQPFLTFDEMADRCDWVLEALPPSLFADLAEPVLKAGKTLVVMSCSQLLQRGDLIDLAKQTGARIVVPSGAMLGLDALKAVAVGRIDSVVIETRKPVAGLQNAPYLAKAGLDLTGLTEPMQIIEGSVSEVAKAFPANVNVAAALSLAGLGPDRTRMQVWADPTLTRNMHRVHITSDSSDFTMTIQNRPTEENPGTGRITPQSVVALLRNRSAALQIGS